MESSDIFKVDDQENSEVSNDEGIDVEEITEEEEWKLKMKRKPSLLGRILMYFVTNKQQKMARRQRSLISRNRRNNGFNASMKRIRQRTMSIVSVVSTNFADSRFVEIISKNILNVLQRQNNLQLRHRKNSQCMVDNELCQFKSK